MSQAASSGYNDRKRKKRTRSQAPVAFVFFVTLIIFCGVFGVFAKIIVDKVSNNNGGGTDVSGSYIDSYNTLYARVNNKDVLSDLSVIRICPEQNRIIVIPMSALTMSVPDGGKTFREVFDEGGIARLKTAVDGTFGISTDYYATMTNDAFEGIADIVGGFSYAPDEELYTLDPDNDRNDISYRAGKTVLLSGRQIRLICQSAEFSNGKQGNMEFLGQALVGIINNGFDQVEITTSSLDVIYNKIFNGSRTNLSENEYREHRAYIREMLARQERPAESLIPRGTWMDAEHLAISDEFRQDIYNLMEGSKSGQKAA